MQIREVVRAGHVTRWHIVRTHRQQTIAEHMYLVTMIARQMAQIVKVDSVVEMMMLTLWCLHHDLPEVFTGDLPALTKKKIKADFDFDGLDDGMSMDIARMRTTVEGTPIEALAKLADLMEAMIFLDAEGVQVHEKGTHAADVLFKCKVAYSSLLGVAVAAFPRYNFVGLRTFFDDYRDSPVRDINNPEGPGSGIPSPGETR